MHINKVKISYPDSLPFSKVVPALSESISNNQIVIVCGETGSGKTTQLPKLLYQLGYADGEQIIGHTQPRRVAAKSLAKRISEELSNVAPNLVGYKMRFTDKTSNDTKIKLMTDGILLQEMQQDRYLNQYSALIIDEAHERSLNIDFILGAIKHICNKRKDLKVIITSATIDNQKFAQFFDNAPIIEIAGKTYPVDIIYQPLDNTNLDGDEISLNEGVFRAASSCLDIERGNVLVFMPGEREIKDCVHYLQKTNLRQYLLLPLFSRQNEAEQDKVFDTTNTQVKIIVTTNVAETSVTIPGIKYVIDSGLARVRRYNHRYKVEQLQIENIAKSSAKQRSGRAGRLSHGLCIRLYSELDYNLRPDFTDAEILRSNLANVVLQLLSLNIGEPLKFPFIERPEERLFNDGFRILHQLGAIDNNNRIQKLGYLLAKIPLDVTLAKILVSAANNYNALKESLIIIACLAIRDPREDIVEQRQLITERQKVWENSESEFLQIMNLWNWYQDNLRHKHSNTKFAQLCRHHFVSQIRLKEWSQLYIQLKECMHNLGFKENQKEASYQELHSALLCGLFNNIGQKGLVGSEYLGVNSKKFLLHPSTTKSGVVGSKWVMCATLMQTTKLYARVCAKIEPQWLVSIIQPLIKHTYHEASWSAKRGQAVIVQHSLFLGLTLQVNKVLCKNINPDLARELFIRHVLIMQDKIKFVHKHAFIYHNQKVINHLENLEEKLRTSLIIIEDKLFEFYQAHLADDIYDLENFEKWCLSNPQQLMLDEDEFIKSLLDVSQVITLYPNYIRCNGIKLKLVYTFDHHQAHDGVTAIIPLEQLNLLSPEVFSWLVPGLIRDKVTYMMKALPKTLRMQLNPINENVTNFLEYANQDQDFVQQLVLYLTTKHNLSATKVNYLSMVNLELPTFLRFHFKVLDWGKVVASSDDLAQLKLELKAKLRNVVTKLSNEYDYEIKNITTWHSDMSNLLEEAKLKRNGRDLVSYYSLVRSNDGLDLTVVDSLTSAIRNTRRGLFGLLKNHCGDLLRGLNKNKLQGFNDISLAFKSVYTVDKLLEDLINYILKKCMDDVLLEPQIRQLNLDNLNHKKIAHIEKVAYFVPVNLKQFEQYIQLTRKNFSNNTYLILKYLAEVAQLYQQVIRKINSNDHPLSEFIQADLDNFIFTNFIPQLPFNILENIPRYLKAMLIRIDKYYKNPERDALNQDEITKLYNAWYDYVDDLEQTNCEVPQELYDFQYKFEELKISLFAPELKTLYTVSAKRLWRELEQFKTNIH